MKAVKVTKESNFFVQNFKVTGQNVLIKHASRKIQGAKDAIEIVRQVVPDIDGYLEEHGFVLALDTKNNVRGIMEVSIGGMNAALIDHRVIFRNLLAFNAVGFILFHNHPSGDTVPSRADKGFTERIKKAADTIEIKLVDHIIIGQGDVTNGYYSFQEMGML